MAKTNDSFRASVLVVDDEAAIRDSLHKSEAKRS